MTYDEWAKSQGQDQSSIGGIEYGRNSIPPPAVGGFIPDFPGSDRLGATVYNAFRGAQNYLSRGFSRPTTNPSFTPMPGPPRPSFSPSPGERPALQMPGANSRLSKLLDIRRQLLDLADPQIPPPNARPSPGPTPDQGTIPLPGYRDLSDRRVSPPPSLRRDLGALRDWFMKNAYDAPGMRDMPRSGGSRFEKDTQYLPGPTQNSTPYPRPPWLNLSRWMDTGESAPAPLDSFRAGGYPGPANPQMPQVYDTLTSGGALA